MGYSGKRGWSVTGTGLSPFPAVAAQPARKAARASRAAGKAHLDSTAHIALGGGPNKLARQVLREFDFFFEEPFGSHKESPRTTRISVCFEGLSGGFRVSNLRHSIINRCYQLLTSISRSIPRYYQGKPPAASCAVVTRSKAVIGLFIESAAVYGSGIRTRESAFHDGLLTKVLDIPVPTRWPSNVHVGQSFPMTIFSVRYYVTSLL